METLGRLAGGVAHDMNNVLAAILGLASANLELQPKDSRAYHAFDIISQAAVRGGNTVKSLLAFAHQKPAEEQDVDLNGVLQEEVRLLERTTLSKVSLEMDLDPNLPPIRGDFNALSSAVMNLCVNAVDAMPGDGTLSLRTRNMGDHWVEVVVEDNGSGMPEEVQAKALDPFFTTKDVGKGTGLGLSMVYRTVEAHGGHMAIDSEVGRGTRIELFFPTCEIPAEPPRDVIEPFLGRPRTALQVLVVDDDELIHTAMRTLIQALGHKVTIAESGEEALAQIEAGFEPDVMILDMNMPGLGGVGTLPRLRVLRPKMPVLIATGRVDQVTLDLIAAHPLTTLMPKPFGMEQLRKHLDAFQSKSRTDAVPRRAQRAGGERRRAEPMHHAGYSGAIRPLGFKGMERRMDAGADRRRH
jgi:CheY-like chemotaxis protein